ncbi:MAG TPA: prolipoprotein diacylglyceryl transferase [Longimicrobiaceae bacterium]|nr:prolipoprotein diacylglyceryl transferase [Longimicrobiaceae bacterium]
MYPVLFEIGGFTVTSFGVTMALAFLVAGWIFAHELERLDEDPDIAWDLVMYAALGGIAGAKLYYLLLNWPQTAADPWGAITSRSGLVWYGGFFGAAALVAWRVHRGRHSIPRFADAAAPALAVGYAIGRLGCFLVGDDYGRPTDLPWGVAFPNGAPPSTAANLRTYFGVDIPASIPGDTVLQVHPTQLYEVGMALIIFTILWNLRKRFTVPGALFALYLLLAGMERLIVEVFRAKDDRFFGPFTLAQSFSLLIIVTAIFMMYRLWSRRNGMEVAK